jgi:hypothetical protein
VATRVYPLNQAAPYTPATIRGTWSSTAGLVTRKLGTAKVAGDTLTTVAVDETSSTNNYSAAMLRFVSDAIPEACSFSTATDTITFCLGVKESDLAANMYHKLTVYVTAGDSDTVRGYLLQDYSSGSEWLTVGNFRSVGPLSVTSNVSAQTGDRIVVVAGYRAQNTSSTTYTATMYYGADSAVDDASGGSSGVTIYAGWIEFSQNGIFTIGTDVETTAVRAQSTAAAPAPTVAAIRNPSVSAVASVSTANAPSPVVAGAAGVTASVAVATALSPTPAVGASISVSAACATASGAAGIPTVRGAATVASPCAAASALSPAPVAFGEGAGDITSIERLIGGEWTQIEQVPIETLTWDDEGPFGVGQTYSWRVRSRISNVWGTYSDVRSITYSGGATITAVTAVSTAAAVAPSVSATTSISVTAVAASATTSAPAPSVAATRSVSVQGVAATAAATAVAPSVSAGFFLDGSVTAVPATAVATAHAPSATTTRSVTVSGVAAEASAMAHAPTVSLGTAAAVVATVATATARAIAPVAGIANPIVCSIDAALPMVYSGILGKTPPKRKDSGTAATMPKLLPIAPGESPNWQHVYDLQRAARNQARLSVFNVLTYGAMGDGSTDDTQAIQDAEDAAAEAGGQVWFPPGTFLTGTITKKSKSHWKGAGTEATILMLAPGTNDDLVRGADFETLTSGSTSGGIHNWSISDMTLDGNKTSQTTGCGLIVYGYGYYLQNVRVRNCYEHGILSQWGSNLGSPGQDSMEAHLSGVKSHGNNMDGIYWTGPHDSVMVNVHTFENGGNGLTVAGLGGGLQLTNGHSWGLSQDYAVRLDALAYLTNCQSEGASVAQVYIGVNDCQYIGGAIYAAGAPGVGAEIANNAAAYLIQTQFVGCTNGAVKFTSDGGMGMVQARVYQESGSSVVGTPYFSTALLISANTPANSLFKWPQSAMTNTGLDVWMGADNRATIRGDNTQAFTVVNQTANHDIFNVNGGNDFVEIVNGAWLRGFSNNYQTVTYQISSADGSIQSGVNPASAGQIRIPNNQYISARNAANNGNVNIARVNASDQVEMPTQTLFSSLGVVPASGTTMVIENGDSILYFHPSGTFDGYCYMTTTGDFYALGDVNCATLTDHTPGYDGDALGELAGVKRAANGHIDHKSLPKFAQTEGGDGRNVSNLVTMLTRAVQQLTERIEQLEGKRG